MQIFSLLIQSPGKLRGSRNNSRTSLWRPLVALLACSALNTAAFSATAPWPTIPLRDLPDPIKQEWSKLAPEMTPASRCATAFDSVTDPRLMTFHCSIHIKIAQEGARRALRYCETARQQKSIRAPCSVIAH